MTPLPRWRLVAGCLVLAAIALLAALFAPVYIRNLKLEDYVDGITHQVENYAKSDQELRALVLERAQQLALPVTEADVLVLRAGNAVRIEVRYMVTVHAPLYTVNLHFYPGAGSR